MDNYWININDYIYPGVIRQENTEYVRNIILLQGFGYSMCDRDYFMSRVANRLENVQNRVFQFDLCGHGDSVLELADIDLYRLENDLTGLFEHITKDRRETIIFGRGLLVSLALKVLCKNKNDYIKCIIGFNPYLVKGEEVKNIFSAAQIYETNLIENLNHLNNFVHFLHALGVEYEYIRGERVSRGFIAQIQEFDVKSYWEHYRGKVVFWVTGKDDNYSLKNIDSAKYEEYCTLDVRLDAMLPFNSFWQSELIERIADFIEGKP